MYDLGDGEPDLAAWGDPERNDAWIGWLERHAPGAVLVDLAAGHGLLAVAAARLGARKVYACDATDLLEELTRRNGVNTVVERCDDARAVPADWAICARLGHEPLAAFAALSGFSRTAPRRIRLFATPVGLGPLTEEMSAARHELDRIGTTSGLDLRPLRSTLDAAEAYRWFTASEGAIGPAVELWDLAPGDRAHAHAVALRSDGPAIAGVAIHWAAELDALATVQSPTPLVLSWPDPEPGPGVRVRFSMKQGKVMAKPLRSHGAMPAHEARSSGHAPASKTGWKQS